MIGISASEHGLDTVMTLHCSNRHRIGSQQRAAKRAEHAGILISACHIAEFLEHGLRAAAF